MNEPPEPAPEKPSRKYKKGRPRVLDESKQSDLLGLFGLSVRAE